MASGFTSEQRRRLRAAGVTKAQIVELCKVRLRGLSTTTAKDVSDRLDQVKRAAETIAQVLRPTACETDATMGARALLKLELVGMTEGGLSLLPTLANDAGLLSRIARAASKRALRLKGAKIAIKGQLVEDVLNALAQPEDDESQEVAARLRPATGTSGKLSHGVRNSRSQFADVLKVVIEAITGTPQKDVKRWIAEWRKMQVGALPTMARVHRHEQQPDGESGTLPA